MDKVPSPDRSESTNEAGENPESLVCGEFKLPVWPVTFQQGIDVEVIAWPGPGPTGQVLCLQRGHLDAARGRC
jgi:hypothetical protein